VVGRGGAVGILRHGGPLLVERLGSCPTPTTHGRHQAGTATSTFHGDRDNLLIVVRCHYRHLRAKCDDLIHEERQPVNTAASGAPPGRLVACPDRGRARGRSREPSPPAHRRRALLGEGQLAERDSGEHGSSGRWGPGAVRAPLARPAPPRAGGGGDGLKAPLEIFDSSVFDVHRGRGE
jgi:hypothetical protein